ncbi:MAG: hypothetical protein RLZZ384_920 [Pseudomonadota bacterium]|jgi:flagellar FliL protein
MRLFILLFSLLLLPAFASAEEHGGGEGEAAAGPAKIQYMEITPKFVVNLVEPKKFLAITVQVLVEGAAADAVKKHMAVIKHELLMLFSDRSIDSLQTMEQRETLRQQAVELIHKTIDKAEGVQEEKEEEPQEGHKRMKKRDYSKLPSAGFKDLFFTEFLLQ